MRIKVTFKQKLKKILQTIYTVVVIFMNVIDKKVFYACKGINVKQIEIFKSS